MNQRSEQAAYNRASARFEIMKRYSPIVQGHKLTYLTTGEVRDELKLDYSLRFIGQQLEMLRFRKYAFKIDGISVRKWAVVRLRPV